MSKEEGAGLGFSVAGGIDLEQKSVVVSDDYKSFLAEADLKAGWKLNQVLIQDLLQISLSHKIMSLREGCLSSATAISAQIRTIS